MLVESVELVAVTTTLYEPGVVEVLVEPPDDLPEPHPRAPVRVTTLNRTANKTFLLRGTKTKQNRAAKAIPESRQPWCMSSAVAVPVVTVRVLVAGDEPETCSWVGLRAQLGGLVAVPLPL